MAAEAGEVKEAYENLKQLDVLMFLVNMFCNIKVFFFENWSNLNTHFEKYYF